MDQGTSRWSGTGWGTLGEVQDGRGGVVRVCKPSGMSGTGRGTLKMTGTGHGTLEDAWDESGDPR